MKEQQISVIDFEQRNSLISFVFNKVILEEEVDDVPATVSAPQMQLIIDDLDGAHTSANTVQFLSIKDLEKLRDGISKVIANYKK
jgi:hypothetical protein